ncbi:O179 family O-antigen polymerase [Escherichia coli]|uniref:O-antigen polymerase n=1 Tax=Escherichia coli TaxID=562 RepID=A0A0A8J9D5_ECOLX|nr:O179 family O-antigen polymerase [Escherichia coli]EIK3324513.1 O179 family O-antigen polymerase [Shigella flexneri]AIG62759.1 O-antigen polymerase [Escherichia coli]EEQ3564996.1 O179 family O-antigen polymerase [Escherichia coli]EES5787687.1 O179 family O-antigen polymerase [Escherichia coli]EEW5464576.1 O179 family O-antigen polymerase [Escherichia coli]
MFTISPVFFENITFQGSRTLADVLFCISLLLIICKHKKVNISLLGIVYIIIVLVIMSVNAALGFSNASTTINNELFDKLTWLILDRNINEFIPFGDYYRNILIYTRYLLIPFYFWMGLYYSKLVGKERAIVTLYNGLIICLLLNMLYGIYNDDDRLTGFFENTAALSSLALLCMLLSLFTKSKYKIILSWVIGIIALLMSQTASAFIGLTAVVLILVFNIRRHHKKTVYITSLLSVVIASIGLMPEIMEFIARYMYTGSLINRINTWSTIINYFDSYQVAILGLGSFPLFADNIFIWLISGFGIFSFVIYMYLVSIGNKSQKSALFISLLLWQGVLFPGFIMPYMLMTTFITLGILSNNKGCENECI